MSPALSKAARRTAAIAKHDPSKLYARNRGMLGMNKQQLHHLAATKEKGLPQKKGKHRFRLRQK